MKAQNPFDVFLSHSHLDGELVEALGIRLTDEAQMNIWLDRWILVPGNHWQQDMAKGLDQARCCAVCIGTHTPKGWFREEIEKALNRQTKEPSFRVIPVILPGGDRDLINDFPDYAPSSATRTLPSPCKPPASSPLYTPLAGGCRLKLGLE